MVLLRKKTKTSCSWLVVFALLLFLSAFILWGIFGQLKTIVTVRGIVKNGEMFAPLYGRIEEIRPGMPVYMNEEYVGYVSYVFEDEDLKFKVCIITGNLADGKYDLDILTESVNLFHFIFD